MVIWQGRERNTKRFDYLFRNIQEPWALRKTYKNDYIRNPDRALISEDGLNFYSLENGKDLYIA